ncbi:MAG: VTT domain-containing protein [Acidobacteria bacterium]|nr:VTT domain-containing protein [Acidobacteriota bacterium]
MVHELLEFLRTLTDPDKLRHLVTTVVSGWHGYTMLFAIVFAETGLLLGFFLPGDSLLFTVGVVAGAGDLNIVLINILLMAAAIIGDAVGYSLGRRAGPKVFSRPDARFFRQEHLLKTKAFYDKHGGKTIIYARFVPIIRTFAPFVAGVAQMPYLRFASFNIFGGIGWVFLMTMLGFTLGNVDIVRRHFEKVVALIILISVLPIVREYAKARRRPTAAPQSVESR